MIKKRLSSFLLVSLSAVLLLSAETVTVPASVRRIQSRCIAPCCWHENLAVHNSPLAAELRAEVGLLASRGESEERIVDRFVSRYGERILAEPRGRPLWILTLTPVALLLMAALLLARWLRRWSRHAPVSMPSKNLPALPDFDLE